MSDSNEPKHVPLVFDEDLKGPIFNNAERNRRIEEQRRRDRERAARSATSNQSITWCPTNHNQTNRQMNRRLARALLIRRTVWVPRVPRAARVLLKRRRVRVLRESRETKTPFGMDAISAGSCLGNLEEEFEALLKGLKEHWKPEGPLKRTRF